MNCDFICENFPSTIKSYRNYVRRKEGGQEEERAEIDVVCSIIFQRAYTQLNTAFSVTYNTYVYNVWMVERRRRKNRWKMDNKKKDTHGEKTKEDSTQKILCCLTL